MKRVHTPDADIDVLCLAPRHCSREAFFTSFCEILRNHAEVDELFPVPEAYTPVSRLLMVMLSCFGLAPAGFVESDKYEDCAGGSAAGFGVTMVAVCVIRVFSSRLLFVEAGPRWGFQLNNQQPIKFVDR